MSEVRGIPKRSKTVVFVVIFVFFQVLALAIVGLLALRNNQEAQAKEFRESVEQRGRDALESVRSRAAAAIAQQLRDTNQIRSFEALEALRARHARPIARRLLRVDRDGTLYWLDRAFVVRRPYSVVKAQADRAMKDVARATAEAKDADAARYNAAERFEKWLRFLEAHPLYAGDRNDPEIRFPYPWAAFYARKMLEDSLIPAARSTEDVRPRPDAVRTGVLRALEVEALNRVRVGTDFDALDVPYTLGLIDGAVDLALEKVPEDLLGALPNEVHAYRAYRRWIRDDVNRRTLEGVLASVAARTGSPVLQQMASGEIYAVTSDDEHPLGFAVIQVDPEAVAALIQAQIDPTQLQPLGLEIRVAGPLEDHDGAVGERLHRADISGDGLDLPGFDAAIFRVREVTSAMAGGSELVFWGIIVFAVLGFLFGTWVLVRLMTREVRLAQLKADFVGNLSHELKTPLTSIGLFTEMLEEGKLQSPEDKAEAYTVLSQEAQRLQRIVQRMIEVARKEAQGVAYDVGPGDLNAVVRNASERFQRIVTEPGLDLSVEVSSEPLPMMLDPEALDDVVTNLLSNAWKYKRGDAAKIRVRTRRRGGKGEVVVADDGIGIPPSERARVFEMFYRADQLLTQPVAGTGLGLALVRTVVRGHKGKITVGAGLDGHGTSFRLRFPLSREAQDALLATRIASQNGGGAGEAHGRMESPAETADPSGAI